MPEHVTPPTRWQRPGGWLLVAVLLGAFVRLFAIDEEYLSNDDMYAASFASDSFLNMLADIARFDIHPPVYFFQLWPWMQLHQGGDVWPMLNSVLWGLLSIVSVYVVADRIFGRRVANIAALLLAVVPIHVEFSRHLRQYTFLTALMPWAWYFSRNYLLEGPGKRRYPLMVISALLVIYTLGTGLVQAMFIGIFGLGVIAEHRPPKARVVAWFRAQAFIVLLSVPAIVNGLVRSHSEHLIEPGWPAVVKVGGYLLAGHVFQDELWAALIFYGLLAFMTATAFIMRRGRWMVLVFGPLPFVMAAVISYLVRPMWHFRQFIFILPFVCMSLGLTLDYWTRRIAERVGDDEKRAPRLALRAIVTLMVLFGTTMSIIEDTQHQRPPTHIQALDHIREELAPGDVILVPHRADFWGVAWYFIGPKWGSPVETQDRIPEHAAPNKWGKALEMMGPEWAEFLHLAPKHPYVEKDGVKLYVGYGSGPEIASLEPERVYIISFPEVGDHDRPLPEIPGYTHDPSEDRFFKSSLSFVGATVVVWRAPPEREAEDDGSPLAQGDDD